MVPTLSKRTVAFVSIPDPSIASTSPLPNRLCSTFIATASCVEDELAETVSTADDDDEFKTAERKGEESKDDEFEEESVDDFEDGVTRRSVFPHTVDGKSEELREVLAPDEETDEERTVEPAEPKGLEDPDEPNLPENPVDPNGLA